MKSKSELSRFVGFVECENPNPKLDNFLGRLTALKGGDKDDLDADPDRSDLDTCSLTHDNLLLSGTVLKNVSEAYGVCVYSGMQTKMSLNSKITSIKFSTVERSLNVFLLFFLLLLISEIFFSTTMSLIFGIEYQWTDDMDQQVEHRFLDLVDYRIYYYNRYFHLLSVLMILC